VDKLEKYADGWSKAEMDVFDTVMGDPTMPDYKHPFYDEWLFHKAWQAALAAATTPPAQEANENSAMESAWQTLKPQLDPSGWTASESFNFRGFFSWGWKARRQYDAPPAQEAGTAGAKWREDGEPDPHGKRYDCERAALSCGTLTDDELANAVYLDPNIAHLSAAKDRIRWLSRKLEESTTPAQEAEPVAWRWRWVNGGYRGDNDWAAWSYQETLSAPTQGVIVEPLYARPQSDKLRQAAEELVEHFTSVQLPPDCTAFVRVENLRAALEGKS
jgi:hypothetical protein